MNKKILGGGLLVLFFLSLLAVPVMAGNGNGNGNVKSNAELAQDRLIELQHGNGHQYGKYKSLEERGQYNHKLVDINNEIEVYSDLDSSTIISTVEKDKRIRLKDIDSEHKLRSVRIAYSDVVNAGFEDSKILITHYNNLGFTDCKWTQEVINQDGYVYFDDLPFSEVVIGGFTLKYEFGEVLYYHDSETFDFGESYNPAEIISLESSIIPVYTMTDPKEVPVDGLVAGYWFDNITDNVVTDISGNGHDGVVKGSYVLKNGKYNKSITLTGDTYIDFGSMPELSNSETIVSDYQYHPPRQAHQGIAVDEDAIYYFNTNEIFKTDLDNTFLLNSTLTTSDTGLSHCGDGDYFDGIIYAPIENYVSETEYLPTYIGRWYANNLTYMDMHNISDQNAEAGSVVVDGENNILYVSSYINNSIYRYNLTTFEYINKTNFDPSIEYVQGIELVNSDIYLSNVLGFVYVIDKESGATIKKYSTAMNEGIGYNGDNLFITADGALYIGGTPPVSTLVSRYNLSDTTDVKNFSYCISMNFTEESSKYSSKSRVLRTRGDEFGVYIDPLNGMVVKFTTEEGSSPRPVINISQTNGYVNKSIKMYIIYSGDNLDIYFNNVKIRTVSRDNTYPLWTGWVEIGDSDKTYPIGENVTINNLLIYDHALNETERGIIFYDPIYNMTLKTNSNSSTSSEITISGVTPVPYSSSDSNITSISAHVSTDLVILDTKVTEYENTLTPFNITTYIVYGIENTTVISEELTDEWYRLYITHTPLASYPDGKISYTSDQNGILDSPFLQTNLSSNNENASYTLDTYDWSITTGPITAGQTYNYVLTAYLEGTIIDDVNRDGIGYTGLGAYEAEGNETTIIGSRFTAYSAKETEWGGNGSDIYIPVAGIILVSVIIIAVGFAINGLNRIKED